MDAKKKKRLGLASCMLGIILITGLWMATQDFAQRVEYNPVLGRPMFVSSSGVPYYQPFKFIGWWSEFREIVPNVASKSGNWVLGSIWVGMIVFGVIARGKKVLDTHGTASWATLDEVCKTKLYEKPLSPWVKFWQKQGFYKNKEEPKYEGVILGRNPYGKKEEGKNFLQHDGAEHIICMAPTRSGKGVGIIIPTLLTWKHSVFVTDIKGENWGLTAMYRKKYLGNRVLKFDPTAQDGSSAKYNPLEEIRLGTKFEIRDVQNIVEMIMNPKGDAKEDHWSRTGASLLTGVILHECYRFKKEGRGVPSLTDIATFLSCPGGDVITALEEMKEFPHISVEEFLSENNVFEVIYQEYIKLFKDLKAEVKGNVDEYSRKLREIKAQLRKKWPPVVDRSKGGESIGLLDEDTNVQIDGFDDSALVGCLTHPKVAEAGSEIVSKPEQERGSVISTALSFLTLYRDPVVAMNTSRSDFCIEDLMRDDYPVSLYLVIPPGDLDRLTPLIRMIINILLSKLTAEMNFEKGQHVKKKQRCLLLLDEFPAFGYIAAMEKGLAYIAGYGLKALLIVQSLNQLNKAYTKENSIVDNCHVRVFFTPNEAETPKYISGMLGKKTIEFKTQSGKVGAVFDSSESSSRTSRELMTAEEVSQIPSDRSIVFVTGNKPIYADKIFYYEKKKEGTFFTDKTDLGAPAISDNCLDIVKSESLCD